MPLRAASAPKRNTRACIGPVSFFQFLTNMGQTITNLPQKHKAAPPETKVRVEVLLYCPHLRFVPTVIK